MLKWLSLPITAKIVMEIINQPNHTEIFLFLLKVFYLTIYKGLLVFIFYHYRILSKPLELHYSYFLSHRSHFKMYLNLFLPFLYDLHYLFSSIWLIWPENTQFISFDSKMDAEWYFNFIFLFYIFTIIIYIFIIMFSHSQYFIKLFL
mgnify:CR=1 FL=1